MNKEDIAKAREIVENWRKLGDYGPDLFAAALDEVERLHTWSEYPIRKLIDANREIAKLRAEAERLKLMQKHGVFPEHSELIRLRAVAEAAEKCIKNGPDDPHTGRELSDLLKVLHVWRGEA